MSLLSAGSSSADRLCPAGCASCSAVNGCLSCKPRLFFHLELDGMRQKGVCLSSCPRGYYGKRSARTNTCNSKQRGRALLQSIISKVWITTAAVSDGLQGARKNAIPVSANISAHVVPQLASSSGGNVKSAVRTGWRQTRCWGSAQVNRCTSRTEPRRQHD